MIWKLHAACYSAEAVKLEARYARYAQRLPKVDCVSGSNQKSRQKIRPRLILRSDLSVAPERMWQVIMLVFKWNIIVCNVAAPVCK